MFSRFDDAEVEDYFNRLNAQLKKMPPEDRREMHQELRQHLDALAAAHEELGASPEQAARVALAQLGEPTQVGRHLMREWRLTASKAKRSLWRLALSVGLGQAAGLASAIGLLMLVLSSATFAHTRTPTALFWALSQFLDYAPPVIGGAIIGFKLSRRDTPVQSVPPAFCASLIGSFCKALTLLVYVMYRTKSLGGTTSSAYIVPIKTLCEPAVVECLVAYTTSLYAQNGGRRLRVADWTLRVK